MKTYKMSKISPNREYRQQFFLQELERGSIQSKTKAFRFIRTIFLLIGLFVLFLIINSCSTKVIVKDDPQKRDNTSIDFGEMSSFHDVGGLRFLANDFTVQGNDSVATGTVIIGFVPETQADFIPLIQLKNGVSITTGNDPQFTTDGEIDLLIETDAVPIFDEQITIDINDLLAKGVAVAKGKSIDVKGLDFTLDTLLFANISGGQIKLHGDMVIPKLDSLTIAVEGENFVVIGDSGIDLTGLKATISPTDSFQLDSVIFIPGSLIFEYQSDSSLYEITGGAIIIVDSDTINVALGDTTNMPGLEIKNGVIADFDLTVTQDKTFHLKGLEFDPEVLNLTYHADSSIYSMYGSLKAVIESDTININAGSSKNPGLEIKEGSIDEINFMVTQSDTFSLKGLSIDPDSLTFDYKKSDDFYSIAGDMYIQAGADTIDVLMHVLEIQDGTIDSLNIAFNSTLSLARLELKTDDLSLIYARDSSEYQITGSVSVEELFDATASFPGKGIEIIDGKWELEDFIIELSDVQLDAFEIKEFEVHFADTLDSYNLDILLSLGFPGGFAAGGSIDFQDGEINELSVDVTSVIPIGDTGVSLYTVGAEVNNLDDVRNLYVEGDIGIFLGESEVDTNFFKVYAQFGVDRSSLQLSGDCVFGFEAQGSININLNWLDQIYTAETKWLLYEIFQLELDFALSKTLISMYGDIALIIPPELPLIGGDELAEAGFYFQRHLPSIDPSDFAAGWGKFLFWEAGVKVPLDDPSNYSVIGASEINNIEQMPKTGTEIFTYSANCTVPSGSTHMVMQGSWPSELEDPTFKVMFPDSTILEPSLSTDSLGIYIDTFHTSSTMLSLAIRNAWPDTLKYDTMPSGAYQLQVTTPTPLTGDTFTLQSHYFIPRPSLMIDSIHVPNDDTIAIVHYTPMSSIHGGSVMVGLFIDSDNTGHDGVFASEQVHVSSAFLEGTTDPDSMTISLANLTPTNYYIYGIIRDTINLPDTSAYSDVFTTSFGIEGTVSDSEGNTFDGIPVQLIQQNNPDTVLTSSTNSNGIYSFPSPSLGFDTLIFTPPYGYELAKEIVEQNCQIVPAPKADMESRSVKKNAPKETLKCIIEVEANATKTVDIGLIELATISGVVFMDVNGDGVLNDSLDYLLSNQSVILQTPSGEQDTLITNQNGAYIFYEVEKGMNTVGIMLPEYGYQLPLDTAAYKIDIKNNTEQVSNKNFGIQKEVIIRGQVFYDYNANGLFEPGDSAISNQLVKLNSSNAFSNDTTDTNGYFLFNEKVLQDTFQVELFNPPANNLFTSKMTQATFNMQSGSPSGSSSLDITNFTLADLDNDLFIDHLVANLTTDGSFLQTIYYDLNVEESQFENGIILHTGNDGSLVYALMAPVADINLDGYNDIVAADLQLDSLFIGITGPDTVININISDFDFTGFSDANLIPLLSDSLLPPDIAYLAEGQESILLLTNESTDTIPQFGGPITLPFPSDSSTAIMLATGDLWGSSLDDLATIQNNGNVFLVENLGQRNFGVGVEYPAIDSLPLDPAITIGDINGDGRSDLVVSSDSIYYLLNAGAGNFDSATTILNSQVATTCTSCGTIGNGLQIVDMDLNGMNDIIIPTDTNEITVLLNYTTLGDSILSFTPFPISTDFNVFLFDVGDINLDGLPDIVYTPSTINYVPILNTTTFASSYNLEVVVGDSFPNVPFGIRQDGAMPPDSIPPNTITVPGNQYAQRTPYPPNPYPVPPNPPRRWVDGNRIRYAVSFYNEEAESLRSNWTEWIEINGFALPFLIDIPTGPEGTIGRKIYRQFWIQEAIEHADEEEVIGALEDNTTTEFQDESW